MPPAFIPNLIVHADWSTNPQKRSMCLAFLNDDNSYRIEAPEQVGDLNNLFHRLMTRSENGSVVVGFDFPIGLPSEYAKLAGITDFLESLLTFGKGYWSEFYDLAEKPSEVSFRRPFYPYRPGGTSHKQLCNALGVPNIDSLRRICERKTPLRGSASPLFWTLGGQQVGRAAIVGWRDLIVPGLSDKSLQILIWPFHGRFHELINPGRIVIVETYPAEACLHIGLTPPGRGWSKRSQSDRKRISNKLFDWVSKRNVRLSTILENELRSGFGNNKDGEDRFDSVVGLFSMLETVLGFRDTGEPDFSSIRSIEGWIFGQCESTFG